MATNNVVAALKRVPLFSQCSDRELREIAKDTREELFSAGQDIVTEGSTGGPMFVILEGRAKVIIGGRTRRRFEPGAYFGEMALIDKGPRSATIRAETQVKAVSITSWNFLDLLESNWKLAHKVLSGMAQRIRELDKAAGQ